MMITRNPRDNRGFTLVEALIAMVILSLGIIALISMQTTSVKGNSKARGISNASLLAQAKIEQFVGADFDTIVDGNETTADGLYTISWTVDDTVLGSVPYLPLKEILVTVSRNDFGAQRDITFTYYRQNEF